MGTGYYDEIEIEDMSYDAATKTYHYPCPCGDRFEITKGQLRNYEDIATCPSCSLIIRVVYDPLDFGDEDDEDEEDGEGESVTESEEEEEEEKTTKDIGAVASDTDTDLVNGMAKIGFEEGKDTADGTGRKSGGDSKDFAKALDAVNGSDGIFSP